ncbi:MAG: DUF4153 domain-containing protein [Clostridia bacterium]|nr:DUF4153 domain-containing protein [Clostridia bacterium]
MKSIKEFFKKFFVSLKDSFSYYPVTISLCILFAVLFVFRIEYMDFASDTLKLRIDTLFLGLGIAVFGSMNLHLLIAENQKFRKFRYHSWAGLLILSGIYYQFGIKDLEMETVIRAFVIMAVLFCSYIIIPWLYKKEDVDKFAVKFMIESVISAFYVSVLFGGLMLIDFAFETLMDVNPEHQFMIFAIAFSYLIVFPMLVFSRIQEEYKQSKILKILIVNIVMPLLTAYTVVLYMYFIRMLVLFTIPSNMITNLVFWYALIGIFTLFIANLYEQDRKWIAIFTKFFPLATFLPLAIMFVALFIRINAYGFTEPRYTLFVIGLWAFLIMIYHFFTAKEKRILSILPVSLGLISLLLVVSPFNMFTVSMTSQNNRFEKLYTDVENLNDTEKSQLLSIVYYFNDNHELSDLKGYPSDMKTNEFQEKYDLSLINDFNNTYYGTNVVSENNYQYVKTDGYQYAFFNIYNEVIVKSDHSFYLHYENTKLLIDIDDSNVLSLDLNNELKMIYEKYKDRETSDYVIMLNEGENELVFSENGVNIKIIIGEFYINKNQSDSSLKPSNIIVLIGID